MGQDTGSPRQSPWAAYHSGKIRAKNNKGQQKEAAVLQSASLEAATLLVATLQAARLEATLRRRWRWQRRRRRWQRRPVAAATEGSEPMMSAAFCNGVGTNCFFCLARTGCTDGRGEG